MPFVQKAHDCPEHPGCTVIVGEQDGKAVWWSHMAADVPPETRINLDHPEVEDHRGAARGRKLGWRLADHGERDRLGWDDETHRAVAHQAANRGLVTDQELQAKTGKTRSELAAEAATKRWAE